MDSLLAKLGLDISPFTVGLEKAKRKVTDFGISAKRSMSESLKGQIGGMIGVDSLIGSLTSMVHKTIEAGDAIGDLSDQLNISTDDVQRLQVLAGQSGLEFNAYATAIEKVTQARQRALEGDGKTIQAFEKYGITLQKLKELGGQGAGLEMLKLLGQAFSNKNLGASDTAFQMELMGKHGGRLAASLQRINELGPIKLISEGDVKAIGELKDALDEIQRSAAVMAAPNVSFWSRVMKRAVAIDAEKRPNIAGGIVDSTIDALYAEITDNGETKSGPITEGELKDARNRVKGAPAETLGTGKGARRFSKPENDNLSKIGLFVGGAGNPIVNISQRQLDVSRRTLHEIMQLRHTMKNL